MILIIDKRKLSWLCSRYE